MSRSHLPAAIYCRISQRYAENEDSIDSQQAHCEAYCAESGLAAPREFQFREADSGHETADDRVELLRLRECVRKGKVGHIVCYNTDRLSREPVELMGLWQEFRRAGVTVKFLLTPTDDSAAGKMMLFAKGFADEIEWLQIRERTNRKKREIRQSGRRVGEGGARFGFRWVKDADGQITRDRAWQLDDQAAEWVRLIYRLAGEGQSMRRIAMELNARAIPTPATYRGYRYKDKRQLRWDSSGVRLIITDEIYMGLSHSHKIRMVGRRQYAPVPRSEWNLLDCAPMPQMVTPEQWALANDQCRKHDVVGRRRRAAETRNEQIFFPFRGLIDCGCCGAPLSAVKVRRWNKETRSHDGSGGYDLIYRCESRRRQKERGLGLCPGKPVHDAKIRDLVWRKVVEILLDSRAIEREIDRLKRDRPGEPIHRDAMAVARKELATCDRRTANLIASLADEDDREVRALIRAKIESLKAEKAQHARRIENLETKLAAYDVLDRKAEDLRRRSREIRAGSGDLDRLSWAERRDVLVWLGCRLVGNGLNVTLELDSGIGVADPLSVTGDVTTNIHQNHQRICFALDPFDGITVQGTIE